MDDEELRAELARQTGLLATEDQARVLKVIEALRNGLPVDAAVIPGLSATVLREWADRISLRKE